jgi:hypothetical protein
MKSEFYYITFIPKVTYEATSRYNNKVFKKGVKYTIKRKTNPTELAKTVKRNKNTIRLISFKRCTE